MAQDSDIRIRQQFPRQTQMTLSDTAEADNKDSVNQLPCRSIY